MEYNTELLTVDKGMKQKSFCGKVILSYVWPLLLLFKISGLATFSVVSNVATYKEKRAFPIFVRSRFGRVYNLILVAVVISSTYVSIPFRINLKYHGKSVLTVGIEIFQATLGALTVCTIVLSAYFYESVLVKTGNRLVHIERVLHQLIQPIDRVRIFREFLCACLSSMSLILAILAMEIVAFTASPISWLGDLVPAFFITLYFIQYFFVVSLLMAYFTDVNRGMQNVARNSMSTIESLYQAHRVLVSGSSIGTLLQLRNIHEWLCDISSDISQFYSVPMIFSIGFFFLTLVYNAYFFVVSVPIEEVMKLTFLANAACWMTASLFPVLLLTWKITNINNEIQKLGSIVHILLGHTIDREAKTQLKLLSLQLLHRNIKFTASGFFALDNTLFHSIITAATTYLVIILQFHAGSKNDVHPSESRNCT